MKVFILGAQGQVGKELVSLAEKSGFDTIAVGRSELDITMIKHVKSSIQLHKPDIVLNAAAYTDVDKAEEEQDIAYAINRDGAENLAAVCKEQNIPLIHISTDYVFDGTKSEAYSENDDVSPLGIYGMSKWQGEEAIRLKQPQHIILRVAWVFGAHGNNFVKTMLRLAKEKDQLNIVVDQFGGPSPAKSISKTLIFLVETYQKEKVLKWGTYHYCGAEKTSWYDFANEIFTQAKEKGLSDKDIKIKAIPSSEYPTPAKRPANSMLDCAKIKSAFGIELPSWKKALNEVLEELK